MKYQVSSANKPYKNRALLPKKLDIVSDLQIGQKQERNSEKIGRNIKICGGSLITRTLL